MTVAFPGAELALVGNTITHISNVRSGVVPDGRCLVCHAAVVAKKGPIKAHHFAYLGRASSCRYTGLL